MKTSMPLALRHAFCCAPLLLSVIAAGDAAAITVTQSSAGNTVALPTKVLPRGPAVPPRSDLLTVDWVDANTGRIAIGGITYVTRGNNPKIVLANGDEVTSIGYLRSGMRAHIETAADPTGVEHLVVIRIAG